MMEVACTCQDGLGVPHSHLGRRAELRLPRGKTIIVDERTAALNPDCPVLRWLDDEVRPWIDWKEVARPAPNDGSPHGSH